MLDDLSLSAQHIWSSSCVYYRSWGFMQPKQRWRLWKRKMFPCTCSVTYIFVRRLRPISPKIETDQDIQEHLSVMWFVEGLKLSRYLLPPCYLRYVYMLIIKRANAIMDGREEWISISMLYYKSIISDRNEPHATFGGAY